MKWRLYRLVMRLAHRYHWCYMKPMPIIEPDWQQYWCQWCGNRHIRYIGRGPLSKDDGATATVSGVAK